MNNFNLLNEDSNTNVIFVAEHASKIFPKEYNNLDMPLSVLQTISDYRDIGVKEVLEDISKKLGHITLYGKYSRLLVDLNRPTTHKQFIRKIEDDQEIVIKGNQNLTENEINKRIKNYYLPFHKKLNLIVKDKLEKHNEIIIISLHSCSPVYKGEIREFDIDILFDESHNQDKELGEKLKNELSNYYNTKCNHPPFVATRDCHTMKRFNDDKRIKWLFLEMNEKLVNDSNGIDKMSKVLEKCLLKTLSKI